jgi:transposase
MSKYDKSFKDEAIRLALSADKSVAQTARDLGIKENTLYNWISMAKRQGNSGLSDDKVNLIEQLQRLRKENARLKEEREILKKAAEFFAKEPR